MSGERVIKGVPPDMTRDEFVADLRAAGSPAASTAGSVYDYAVVRGFLPSALLGFFNEESSKGTNPKAIAVSGADGSGPTYSWGNTTTPSYGVPDLGPPYVRGRFSRYAGWAAGGIATVARFFDKPDYKDALTVREIVYIWAPPSDNNRTEDYIAGVDAEIARLGKGARMATPREVTDRLIATLRGRGREVIDLRGRLPVNPNPGNRYGLVRGGLGGVEKLIQHWTGDAFSRATIAKIVGTDYGTDTIVAAMSSADEIDLLTWYANFHIGKDNRTWGGIAYGIMVLPSGRIYVNWDIGTLTYHAFSVNAYSYAICAPASNGQAPTQAQLLSLNHIWYILCEETPEIPAGWGDLWGHTEARQFDSQNQTTCPGPVLLGHVQRARAAEAPSVPINTGTTAPPQGGAVVEAPDPFAAERKALLDWCEALPFQARGPLMREGEADLRQFGGGQHERVAIYGKQRFHRLAGQTYGFNLDGAATWEKLLAAKLVTLF